MEGTTADSVNDSMGSGLGSPVLDEVLSEQQSQSGDSLAEWRSSEQVENGTPSTSPPYWDTEDDDDAGPKPSELFGKFTWKIENFSQINKRELKSDTFVIGGHKWYILIYPQGCDVCNHLSLFLCVANHEKLLPGWSHFAQFTIAVVNKDPKKSKYSDTLHRFWKKEHDWGWKKFMELSKVVDGFIVADTLVIKAQVQVIREKIHRPFRCLDCQYRRELIRVYLSNVEQICRRFVEDRKEKLCKLIFDRTRWSSLRLFWSSIDQNARWRMSRDKKDAILKVVVKHFFIEKEVTSTLVMDSLHSGLKAIEWQSESKKGIPECEKEDLLADSLPVIVIENDMFVLADDVLVLVERTALEPLPPKDDKGAQGQNLMQNRTKDASSSDEFGKDSIDRDERRLTELGCRTLEMFVLAHIFSRVEVAYQEVVALKRQEELIREEEAACLAENLLKAKRSAAEKEKRSKKKQAKQKRNNRRVKDKGRDEKLDETVGLESQTGSISNDITLDDTMEKQGVSLVEKFEVLHISNGPEISDRSITGIQDIDTSPKSWDKDVLGVCPETEASSSKRQNEEVDKNPSLIDDSSSTSSTDSAFLVVTNGTNRTNNNKGTAPPNMRNNRRNKSLSGRTKRTQNSVKDETSEVAVDVGSSTGASDNVSPTLAEINDTVPSSTNDLHEYLLIEKKEDGSLEVRECMDQVDQEAPSMSTTTELSSSSNPVVSISSSQQPKQITDHTASSSEPALKRESSSNRFEQTEKLVASVITSVQETLDSTMEMQRMATNVKVTSSNQLPSVSRPPSAPLIATSRPATTFVSTSQTAPVLSRSASAISRLGTSSSLAAADSFVPQSYRNAIMGRNSTASSTASFALQSSLSNTSRGGLYPLPAAVPVSAPSSTISFPSRSHPAPVSPGFTFGSVNPKALNGGSFWNGDRSLQELRSQTNVSYASGSSNNAMRTNSTESLHHHGWYPEFTPKAPLWQKQGTGTDEFPHLDIINYLLDEEHSDAKTSGNGYNQLTMSRQYTFPGCLASADARSTGRSFGFEDQYCRDVSQIMYNPSVGPLDGREELLLPQMDPVAYAMDNMNGMILNQWPSSIAADSPLLGVSSAESNGYPYHLQNYSNITCGMNGYAMYRNTNGF